MTTDHPNIILILAENKGYGEISSVSSVLSRTPVLEALSRERVG